MMNRHIWTVECYDIHFTNILYTFFKTMYIPQLDEVSNSYCYYIVCVCVCVWCTSPSQTRYILQHRYQHSQVTQTQVIVPKIHAKKMCNWMLDFEV